MTNYCGGSPQTSLQPIITTQKKILRFITLNSYDSHTKPIFLHHKILPFTQIYQLNLAILMHKIKNKAITGSYHLIPLNQQHSQNTRLSKGGNYFQKFQKTSYGQSTFSTSAVKLWRTVPMEIKGLPLHLFKRKYKQHLFKTIDQE